MTEFLSKSSIARILIVSLALFLTSCGSPEQQAQKYYEKGMQLIAAHDDLNARVALSTSQPTKPTGLTSGGRWWGLKNGLIMDRASSRTFAVLWNSIQKTSKRA